MELAHEFAPASYSMLDEAQEALWWQEHGYDITYNNGFGGADLEKVTEALAR